MASSSSSSSTTTTAAAAVPCALDAPPPPKRARTGDAATAATTATGPEHYARLLNVYEVPMRLHARNRERLVARFRADAGVPAGSILLFQGGASTLRHARHDSFAERILTHGCTHSRRV